MSLSGVEFWPGFCGLNNLKKTDYLSVIIQAFSKVESFKLYCLLFKQEKLDSLTSAAGSVLKPNQQVVVTFIDLIKKMWNPKSFKGQVSPHELTQAVSISSNKMFQIGTQYDPIQFIPWFFNQFITSGVSNS